MERARDDLVREQRTTMSQIQEERRTLATERAQLSSAHKDLISREKLKTETSVQVGLLINLASLFWTAVVSYM